MEHEIISKLFSSPRSSEKFLPVNVQMGSLPAPEQHPPPQEVRGLTGERINTLEDPGMVRAGHVAVG